MGYKPPCKKDDRGPQGSQVTGVKCCGKLDRPFRPARHVSHWHMYSIEPSNPGRGSMSRSDTHRDPCCTTIYARKRRTGATRGEYLVTTD